MQKKNMYIWTYPANFPLRFPATRGLTSCACEEDRTGNWLKELTELMLRLTGRRTNSQLSKEQKGLVENGVKWRPPGKRDFLLG